MLTLRRCFSWLCLLAVCLQFVFAPQGAASANTGAATTTYLPIILREEAIPEDAIPVLNSPADGAVLTTLAPTVDWTMGTHPANSSGCLAIGKNPNPTGCEIWFGIMDNQRWGFTVWQNLDPNTVYYWRIGIILENEDTPSVWSLERSFTTAPSGGQLPAAPVLTAPANNSTVSSSGVTLSWAPVSGATMYQVRRYLKSEGWVSIRMTSSTQTTLSGSSLKPNTQYEWWVTAMNDYGWGPDSPTWIFKTPAASSVQPGSAQAELDAYIIDAQGRLLRFEQ